VERGDRVAFFHAELRRGTARCDERHDERSVLELAVDPGAIAAERLLLPSLARLDPERLARVVEHHAEAREHAGAEIAVEVLRGERPLAVGGERRGHVLEAIARERERVERRDGAGDVAADATALALRARAAFEQPMLVGELLEDLDRATAAGVHRSDAG